MNKTLRYILKGIGIAAAILIIFWLAILWYVSANKKEILAKVSNELGNQTSATVSIGDLDPAFFQTFPFLSLRLSNISMRDSLWNVHHNDFLKAEKFFIRVNPFSLMGANPKIDKIIVEKGSIFLFTDTSNYTNAYILTPKEKSTKKGMRPPFDEIELKNVRLRFINPVQGKLFDFDISKLACEVDGDDEETELSLKMDMLVHDLAFNTDRGIYLQEKRLEGRFDILLQEKLISFDDIKIKIDRHPFTISGKFYTGEGPNFSLDINTKKAVYGQVTKMLPERLQKKLDTFQLSRTVDANASIRGSLLAGTNPAIKVNWVVNKTDLKTPVGDFKQVSLTGRFTNLTDTTKPASDDNSTIVAESFTGIWENIPLSASKIIVSKLAEPKIAFDLHTSVDMIAFNELTGMESFDFQGGKAEVNINFSGPLMKKDTTSTLITGAIDISDGELTYQPRKLQLSRCNGSLIFDNKDVFVKEMKAYTKRSDLLIGGRVNNFLSALNLGEETMLIDLNIDAAKLDLNDFTQNLQKRNTRAQNAGARLSKMAAKIDKLIAQAAMKIDLTAKKLTFKKFEATDLKASIDLDKDEWTLKNVSLNHAGGRAEIKGFMKSNGEVNPFQLSGNMQNIDISKVFYAFNNFSIDGLTDKNLQGVLTANFDISAMITSDAELVPYSTRGKLNISLKDGALQNFEPMQKISASVFKNRDMSDIRFAELKDNLDINGSAITINSLEIQSTVLSMFIEGVYDLKTGPDLSILVPLSNLKKRDADFELVNKGTESKKGVSVHLRARNGDDGKVKIVWDPFKKAIRNKDKKVASR